MKNRGVQRNRRTPCRFFASARRGNISLCAEEGKRDYGYETYGNGESPGDCGLSGSYYHMGKHFRGNENSIDMLSPAYVLAYRFTIASLGLAVLFHRRLIHMNRRDLHCGIVLGFLLGMSYVFQTYGLQHTTASKNCLYYDTLCNYCTVSALGAERSEAQEE